MLYRRLALEWLLVLLVASVAVGWAASRSWTQAIDNKLYDVASGWAARTPDQRILLVEIDDASLRAIGRWPWPRSVHRALLDQLARARPAAVSYDVLFLEPTADDAGLAAAMRHVGKVYLPALIERDHASYGPERLTMPSRPIADAAQVGIAEVILDEDGVVRRADLATGVEGGRAPQMTALLARQIEPRRSLPAHQPFLLPMARGDAFRRVSFEAVLRGEVPDALIRGRIILVGATAGGMGDIYPVPSSAGGLMPGVQIQANLLDALLGGRAIRPLSSGTVTVVSLLPTWLLLLAFLRFRPGVNLRLSLAAIVGVVGLSMALVPLAHIWFPPGAALLGIIMVPILWGWRRLAAMSQFVGQQAAAILAEPGIVRHSVPRQAMTDRITQEADQLQDIIEQLRTLRLFTADVIARLPDATVVADEAGTILLANEAAVRLFGAEVQGLRLDLFLARIRQGATDEGSRIILPGGETLVMTDAPLAGGGRIVRLADMTDLQRATDEREEVLQFLTHDLRSPHAAILTLLETQAVGEKGRSIRDRIGLHARHGLRLADDFVQLARARRRPIAPEPVDLCDVAREAMDMVWPKAIERGVRIVDGSAGGEIWALGDHAMLLRAVVNLLDNAVKFAPDRAQVDIAVAIEADQACLTVAGPGPEMPPGRIERPFALYAEGRDVSGRTSIGLGLALVQATALRHGGTASYRHEDGYGAIFSIRLPLAADD